MKSPRHPTPSGDRAMAQALLDVLGRLGHEVHLVEGMESYHQAPEEFEAIKDTLNAAWLKISAQLDTVDPDLWITYHSYYKSPDLLGPRARRERNLTYLIVEPSYAPLRRHGPWHISVEHARNAILEADLLLVMKQKDRPPIEKLVPEKDRIRALPPFIATDRFVDAATNRATERPSTIKRWRLSSNAPLILCTAMMRAGKKLESYAYLASALKLLDGEDWQLVIAGDGPQKAQVKAEFSGFAEDRIRWLGHVAPKDMATLYAAADVFAWPGLGEAYGMVYLEAGAARLPSIAVHGPGVEEIIQPDTTGLLLPTESPEDYARALQQLLVSPDKRQELGANAQSFICHMRSSDSAMRKLELLSERREKA